MTNQPASPASATSDAATAAAATTAAATTADVAAADAASPILSNSPFLFLQRQLLDPSICLSVSCSVSPMTNVSNFPFLFLQSSERQPPDASICFLFPF